MPNVLLQLDPDEQQIGDCAKEAIANFYKNDMILVSKRTREECLSHRLAYHLQVSVSKPYPELVVDCEYDKFGDNDKTVGKAGIRPDILFHLRGYQTRNMLVVEVKKKSHPSKWDDKKLKWLTSQKGKYHYKLGLFVGFISSTQKPKM
jgi:hypothetical protein